MYKVIWEVSIKYLSIFAISLTASGLAFAGEAEDEAAGYKCNEAKELVKIMKKMTSMKPDQTDTVHGNPTMKMIPKDDLGLPDRVFFRSDGKETPFSLSKDGVVTDFHKIGSLSKKGEMCIEDKDRAGLSDGEGGIDINMNFHIEYKNKTGTFTLPELRDGLVDGRTHVKKLVPGPVRMLIPKFTHVAISYEAEEADPIHKSPQIVALLGDVKLDGLVVEHMLEAHYVEIDQLEALGADRLGVYGGDYRMEPSASPEKMRKMVEKRRKKEAEN